MQYASKTLGTMFPDDPDGVILVKLSRKTDAGFGIYDPNAVTVAEIYAGGTLNYIPQEC